MVRRYTSVKAYSEFIATLGMAKIHASNGELKIVSKEPATVFQVSYPGMEWPAGASFRFFSVQKSPAIAISCTPSKFGGDDWADFLALLDTMFPFGSQEVWKEFRVCALEIAMDVKVPFHDLVCLAPRVSTVDQTYFKVGSLYLGHMYGRRSYCIYDKRKQLAEEKSVYLDYDLTRVEVTLRQTGQTLEQLGLCGRPFGNLLVLRKSSVVALKNKYPLSIEVKAFVKAILAGCVAQNAYLDMDPYSRKKLLKILRPGALKLNSDSKGWKDWFAIEKLALQSKFLAT